MENTDVKQERVEIPLTATPTESSAVVSAPTEAVKEAVAVEEKPEVKHEEAIPYERFKEVNEAKKEAERKAQELEMRLSQLSQAQAPQKKEYSLEELQHARDYWLEQNDTKKAMQVADMIYERKISEQTRLVAADIEDRYRAESENPDLKDRSSELYRETDKVFREMGNLTRSQAADIAYARLARAGKVNKPQVKFEPKGQLGAGTSQGVTESFPIGQDEVDFCHKAGISVDKYREQKKLSTIARR